MRTAVAADEPERRPAGWAWYPQGLQPLVTWISTSSNTQPPPRSSTVTWTVGGPPVILLG